MGDTLPRKEKTVSRTSACLLMATAVCVALIGLPALGATALDAQVERGKYLVTLAGCSDCHTPGVLTGQPDMQRYLGGSDVGYPIPGEGTFVPRNLTPDMETGLGNWTTQEIVAAITAGTRPDGRILALVMPWVNYAHLTTSDALAIAVYLKSLRPVKHAVPGPFGPTEKPTVRVMPVISADDYMTLSKVPAPTAK
jgi:mono/diheme cytochrome c family protein